MISRAEFYIVIGFLSITILLSLYSNHTYVEQIQRAKIETIDSVLQVQKDSAFARALQYEIKADSLQAVINRKKLDIQNIRYKYEKEKKNVLILNADSTLRLFERSVTH